MIVEDVKTSETTEISDCMAAADGVIASATIPDALSLDCIVIDSKDMTADDEAKDPSVEADTHIDSEGEEFRIIKPRTLSTSQTLTWAPREHQVRRADVWRNRQHRKMIASIRRYIEWNFADQPVSLESILESSEIRDLTDSMEDILEAVSKSTKLRINESNEVVRVQLEQPVPLLALPYKRFIYKFDGADFIINKRPISLSESSEVREASIAVDGDTGNTIWDAAVFLSKYLEGEPHLVEQKHVLELGSGLGLCGISAHHLGASSVTFTDLGYILNTTKSNLSKNSVEIETNPVVELDWCNPQLATIDWSKIQAVIASDILWLDKLVDPFVNTLSFIQANCPNLEHIILSNQRRSDLVRDSFITKAQIFFQIHTMKIDGNLEIVSLTRKCD